LAGELLTTLGQTDYASQIAQIRASGADSVFVFLPGGMGISFPKQYANSGVDIPLIGPAFSFDQGILQAVGDAALGAIVFVTLEHMLGGVSDYWKIYLGVMLLLIVLFARGVLIGLLAGRERAHD